MESVPEAGGTGAEAVATPTTPPAGHDAESPVKSVKQKAEIATKAV